MKNDSGMFPTETPMDSWFDSNHDGELSGFETMQRDAMLYKSYEETTDAFDEITDSNDVSCYSSGPSMHYSSYDLASKKQSEPTNEPEPLVTGDWGQTICIVLAAIILVGQFIVCVAVGSLAPMLIGTIIGIVLLRVAGVLTFG